MSVNGRLISDRMGLGGRTPTADRLADVDLEENVGLQEYGDAN